jgi:threonine/homoserine/homoserine lactone efflux protein
MISRLAVTGSRGSGVIAAVGMGAGGTIFACLALGGLIALLQQVEWLFLVLKICGGLYLIYLGIRIWRSASERLQFDQAGRALPPGGFDRHASTSSRRSFWLGLTTQIANPKTAVVYAGIFAALLPEEPRWILLMIVPPAVFLVEFVWYALVAVFFSASGPRRAYLRSKGWLDRIAGSVLGTLGARLIVEEVR